MGKKDLSIITVCVFILTILIIGGLKVFYIVDARAPKLINLNHLSGQNINSKKTNFGGNTLPANQDESVRLLFFGDLMLDRHVGEKIAAYGFDYLFADLATTSGLAFGDYDLVSANLEGAVTDGGAHYAPAMGYDFAFATDTMARLKGYNFSFFNLANNHFADQGGRGIIETRRNLDALGFAFAGCEDGAVGDCSLRKLRIKNLELGIIGFSLVYNSPDMLKMASSVAELASTTDLVIVNVHWGTEYEHKFRQSQQQLAHALVDAGADIIIGHHPHVVQGMEIYRSKPIFYSLGNFIFDQYFSPDTQEELAAGITMSGEKMEVTLYPLRSKASQPALLAGEEKEDFLKKFVDWSELSEEYKTQLFEGDLTLVNF